MRILCTGSSGFICGRLIERLRDEGHKVHGFDVRQGQDVRSLGQVRQAVSGMDAAFHLAAVADLNWARVHPEQSWAINDRGTFNVVLACRESGAKLYFASTCCVYGNQPVHPVTEDVLPRPAEIYACSKLAGENAIRGVHLTLGGPDYNMMRFATIYGPGTRPALATHIFMGQALRGEPVTVHGDGSQTRTLTYVDDLVDGMVALLNSGRLNEAWNLSTEEEVSALQMAQDIKAITHSDSPIVFIPQRVGQTFRESISAAKMRELVGWQAKTRWADGLEKMYEWFMATGQAEKVYQMPAGAKVAVRR